MQCQKWFPCFVIPKWFLFTCDHQSGSPVYITPKWFPSLHVSPKWSPREEIHPLLQPPELDTQSQWMKERTVSCWCLPGTKTMHSQPLVYSFKVATSWEWQLVLKQLQQHILPHKLCTYSKDTFATVFLVRQTGQSCCQYPRGKGQHGPSRQQQELSQPGDGSKLDESICRAWKTKYRCGRSVSLSCSRLSAEWSRHFQKCYLQTKLPCAQG